MSPTSPAVRARSCQETLAYLEVYRPGARAEVERRIAPDVLDRIRSTLGNGWIPIEMDAAMARAIFEYLGPDEARRFWTRFITHHLDSPLLAAPVRTAMSLLGMTPASLVKWMPRVLSAVYRDVFDLHIEALEPNRAVLRYEVHSDVFLEEPVFAVVLESTLRALIVVTGATGGASVARNLKKRSYRVEATWESA